MPKPTLTQYRAAQMARATVAGTPATPQTQKPLGLTDEAIDMLKAALRETAERADDAHKPAIPVQSTPGQS